MSTSAARERAKRRGHHFLCLLCLQQRSDVRDFLAHLNKHLDKRHWACDKCGKTAFWRKDSADKHIKNCKGKTALTAAHLAQEDQPEKPIVCLNLSELVALKRSQCQHCPGKVVYGSFAQLMQHNLDSHRSNLPIIHDECWEILDPSDSLAVVKATKEHVSRNLTCTRIWDFLHDNGLKVNTLDAQPAHLPATQKYALEPRPAASYGPPHRQLSPTGALRTPEPLASRQSPDAFQGLTSMGRTLPSVVSTTSQLPTASAPGGMAPGQAPLPSWDTPSASSRDQTNALGPPWSTPMASGTSQWTPPLQDPYHPNFAPQFPPAAVSRAPAPASPAPWGHFHSPTSHLSTQDHFGQSQLRLQPQYPMIAPPLMPPTFAGAHGQHTHFGSSHLLSQASQLQGSHSHAASDGVSAQQPAPQSHYHVNSGIGHPASSEGEQQQQLNTNLQAHYHARGNPRDRHARGPDGVPGWYNF